MFSFINVIIFFSSDAVVKQNLNSLLFVKNICESRIKRLIDGVDDNNDVSKYY
jgi:hypothetical protein